MARGAAGNLGRRALSDHVICGALDRPGTGPQRRARRFQMACAGCARRSQARRRPARGRRRGVGPDPELARRAFTPCFQRIEKAYPAGPGPIMRKKFLAALIILSACSLGPARAEDAPAPFDGDLQRLAEILGTLHYLRGICGANEGMKWRNEMQALIDAETPSGDRRARMIAGFNRGYNGFQQTYRTCTPAASVAIRRYIEEGSKISRDLTARYAN